MTRFVVDEKGNRTAVLMDIEEYNRLLEDLDELDAIRAFDRGMADTAPPIPLDQALAEIQAKRRA